ncbi:hypothetical protein FNAPI_13722 [Fusarium napiforme]|uniref:Uncharacterized protein n=1 Tax=Fusarium napiforme TaxID=42672 RepID=A0A8H5MJ75_9HYPO|nr:hypothetical protein FNAPI_13722 [Fusarium napiforme]
MAPNNTNSSETPVSEGSESYKAGAARRDGKRGRTSSTNNLVRKKVHQDEEPDLPLFNRGSGGAQRLYEGREALGSLSSNVPTYGAHHWSAGRGVARQSADCNAQHSSAGSLGEQGHEHLPAGSVSVRHEHLPAGSVSAVGLPSGRRGYEHLSADSVSANRLPAGRQNDGNLSAGSVSMMTPLPSNVWGENEIDEFPDSDLDGLPEAEIEQLVGPALSRAPVVGEDDGQKTRENAVEEFLDSDLDSLSETEIQRLLDQAVPKSAKAVDGNDSEAPAMDVGESHMGVEPIDVDAQILEKDRIDAYISNVEDDGMECFIDEEFLPDDVRENEPLTVTEGTGVAVRAEQVFYDRAWVACEGLCQTARAEREWDSEKSPLSISSWNWFRKTEPGKLADIVYKRMVPEVRQALSKRRPDVLDLLELPEPKRDDLTDSCNGAGVYVFVCHAERKVDPRSGDLEAVDIDSVGCYTGQSIARPQDNGREGMSLRFDQHRRELRRTIPELEEKANKASTNVPRFYRTVVENELEAHPRVVATLPRDGNMAAHAMLIETVIMIMTGSVSEESSYGLPTKDMVADIQEQLAFEGRLRYQPKTLNRALPVRQGFRSNVRVSRNCELSCRWNEVYNFERLVLESEYGAEDLLTDKSNLVCGGTTCANPRQTNYGKVRWTLSRIHLLQGEEVWYCGNCRVKERKTAAGKAAELKLQELQDEGLRIPGLLRKNIPQDMRYCQDPDCPKLEKSDELVKLTRSNPPKWSLDPAHPMMVLCTSCFERERKRLVREILSRRGIDVDNRRLKIHENDKVCSQENCKDPHQEGMKARMEAGEQAKHGHIWFRHPMEMGGRVLCKSCHMAVLLALRTEANRRALERINNSVD